MVAGAEAMMRQLWHVLFGHLPTFAPGLPVEVASQYIFTDIDWTDFVSWYWSCPCGLMGHHYAAWFRGAPK